MHDCEWCGETNPQLGLDKCFCKKKGSETGKCSVERVGEWKMLGCEHFSLARKGTELECWSCDRNKKVAEIMKVKGYGDNEDDDNEIDERKVVGVLKW